MDTTHQPAIRGVRPRRALAGLGASGGVALLLLAAGCGGASTSTTETSTAQATSAVGLRNLGQSLHQPIYWVGPRAGATYERTLPVPGRVLVRYLPAGAKVGSAAAYLTVATYAVPDAYAAAQRAAGRPGAIRIKVATSAIAFTSKTRPLNAWITYPGSSYQIEVFAPTPGAARRMIASGRVARVPGSPKEVRPVQVSARSLATVATKSGRSTGPARFRSSPTS